MNSVASSLHLFPNVTVFVYDDHPSCFSIQPHTNLNNHLTVNPALAFWTVTAAINSLPEITSAFLAF